jgi:hypothetical protein
LLIPARSRYDESHRKTIPALSRMNQAYQPKSPYATILTAVGGGAEEVCASIPAWSSIDRIIMTVRTTDCNLASPENLNAMCFAHMLAGPIVDEVAIAFGAHNPPLSVEARLSPLWNG